MGLDIVEFVQAVEDAFDVRIADEEAGKLDTPGKVIDYLVAHLPRNPAKFCLAQQVFYRLRSALCAELGCVRSAVRPDTSLLNLVPAEAWNATWDGVRQRVGAAKNHRWPRLGKPCWYDFLGASRIDTLREATQSLVANLPRVGKRPDASWSREEIRHIVRRLMKEELDANLDDASEDRTWDELGID